MDIELKNEQNKIIGSQSRSELIAVNRLEYVMLLSSSLIIPYISRHDKEPFWDGKVCIYNSLPIRNSTQLGEVNIQIKGHETTEEEELLKEEMSYNKTTICDLEYYKENGGVLFFLVVWIEDKYRIYYASLLPITIKHLLESAQTKGNKKNKGFELFRFPVDNPDEIKTILTNFAVDSKKQHSLHNFNLSSIRELIGLTVGNIPLSETTSLTSELVKYKPYVYGITPEGISLPLSRISEIGRQVRKKRTFKVNGKQFLFDSCLHETTNNEKYLEIGSNGLWIDLNAKQYTGSISGYLNEQILLCEFTIEFTKTKHFICEECGIDYCDVNINFPLDEIRNQLEQSIKIRQLLSDLGVTEELFIDNFSDLDHDNLEMLYNYKYNPNYRIALQPGMAAKNKSLQIFTIGNLNIAMKMIRQPDKFSDYTTYTMESAFCNEITDSQIKTTLNNGETYDNCIFAYLIDIDNGTPIIHNVNFTVMYDAITQTLYSAQYVETINCLLLSFIKSYDKYHSHEILDFCIKIAEWLVEKEPVDALILNLLQCRKRKGRLNDEDIQQIIEIRNNNTDNLIIQAFVSILLDSCEADHYMSIMKKNQYQEFIKYPIINLKKS